MAARILVVDDEPHILQVLALKLGEAGYEVQTAADGRRALELVREQRPDLVITDLKMPHVDGAELCHSLRDDPRTRDIPLFVLTARGYTLESYDLPEDIRVLSKPFSPKGLLKVIGECLQGRKTDTPPRGGMEAA
ncbi:MAG: response regulator [Planctomycetota bacterium]|jgi:CheY-like chemotaxis protein